MAPRPAIVLVGPARFAASPPFAGGLESFVATLATGLRRRGHRVVVVAGVRRAGSGTSRRCDIADDATDARRDGIALRDAVADVVRTLDVGVVHNSSFSPEVLDLIGSVPRFETTLHTPPEPDMVAALRERSAAVLSTPSQVNADAWSGALARHIDVVANGVDRTVFRPAARREPYLAWIGRIVPEKGLHLALDTAALLETPLRFAGPIHDRRYFDEWIRPRASSGVRYEGHLDPLGLATLLGGATATLVTPLWPEPFGLTVIESLACGTPVAAVANGALRPGAEAPFCTPTVVCADEVTPTGLAAAVLAASTAPRSRCRASSAPFDLSRMVLEWERRYGLPE